jgi:hypothetical protein
MRFRLKQSTRLERQANWQSICSGLFLRRNSALCLTLRSKAEHRKSPEFKIGIAHSQITLWPHLDIAALGGKLTGRTTPIMGNFRTGLGLGKIGRGASLIPSELRALGLKSKSTAPADLEKT